MRRFAHSWVLFLLAALPLRAAPENAAGGRPDVLFIAIDDMNDWISLLDPGSPIKTPNPSDWRGGEPFLPAPIASRRPAILPGLPC